MDFRFGKTDKRRRERRTRIAFTDHVRPIRNVSRLGDIPSVRPVEFFFQIFTRHMTVFGGFAAQARRPFHSADDRHVSDTRIPFVLDGRNQWNVSRLITQYRRDIRRVSLHVALSIRRVHGKRQCFARPFSERIVNKNRPD